jgi:hypothetical protein
VSTEVQDRAGPVAGSEEDLVGPVVEVLVGKGLPELDRLLQVIVDAVRRWFPGPPDDDVGSVALNEDVAVFAIPGIVECCISSMLRCSVSVTI